MPRILTEIYAPLVCEQKQLVEYANNSIYNQWDKHRRFCPKLLYFTVISRANIYHAKSEYCIGEKDQFRESCGWRGRERDWKGINYNIWVGGFKRTFNQAPPLSARAQKPYINIHLSKQRFRASGRRRLKSTILVPTCKMSNVNFNF